MTAREGVGLGETVVFWNSRVVAMGQIVRVRDSGAAEAGREAVKSGRNRVKEWKC